MKERREGIIRKEVLFKKEMFDRMVKAVELGKYGNVMKFIRASCDKELKRLGIN